MMPTEEISSMENRPRVCVVYTVVYGVKRKVALLSPTILFVMPLTGLLTSTIKSICSLKSFIN